MIESSPPDSPAAAPHFTRVLGLRSAIAVNMTQMCGIGPFITIPQIIAAMGGPQAIVGWVLGAGLAMADGLVWAELGAAMPGAGGTYLYLREAFQYRTGRLMPFLFIWSVMVFIPLTMSTGVVGIVDYLRYYVPDLSAAAGHAISLAITALVVVTLYRKITAIQKLTNVLFVVMLVTVVAMILAAFTHFDAHLAFTFPNGAFDAGGPFWSGLGAGLLIATYDYLGYNTTAYMAAELRDPGRVLPGSILYAIVGIMLIYLSLNVGVLGVLPWQEVAKSTSIGSAVMENTWGKPAAQCVYRADHHHGLCVDYDGFAGRLSRPLQRRQGQALLPDLRPPPPAPEFSSYQLVGHGDVYGDWNLLLTERSVQHADGRHGADSRHCSDRRPDSAAAPSADSPPAVPHVAVSAAEPSCTGWLALYLRKVRTLDHSDFSGLACPRRHRFCHLGVLRTHLALWRKRNPRRIPRAQSRAAGTLSKG